MIGAWAARKTQKAWYATGYAFRRTKKLLRWAPIVVQLLSGVGRVVDLQLRGGQGRFNACGNDPGIRHGVKELPKVQERKCSLASEPSACASGPCSLEHMRQILRPPTFFGLTPSIWQTASITTFTGAGGFFMLLTCRAAEWPFCAVGSRDTVYLIEEAFACQAG